MYKDGKVSVALLTSFQFYDWFISFEKYWYLRVLTVGDRAKSFRR